MPEDFVDEAVSVEDGKRDEMEQKGGMWSSRTAFVFAAIGCAFGLGSVWRFPYLVYQYGGLVFILMLGVFYVILGVPLLSSEFVFGQVFQVANVPAYNAIHPRLLGVGVGPVLGSLIIATYYNLIICWTLIYFFNSFLTNMPWALTPAAEALCASFTNTSSIECLTGGGTFAVDTVTYNSTGKYTTPTDNCVYGVQGNGTCSGNILGVSLAWGAQALNFGDPYNPEVFSWQILVAFLVIWILQFIMLSSGPKILGYMMYVTMTLPIIMMITLLIVAVTLPGAGSGLQAYIGKWEGSVFSTEPEIWSQAASQCFFSLTVCQGSMMTYGAYAARDSPCGQDSVIVVFSTFLFSILAGFSVFGIIGYLSYTSGIAVDDLPLSPSNALAFQTFPVGAAALAYPLAQIVSVLFFFMLFLLGISAAVACLEPFLSLIYSSRIGHMWKRWKVTATLLLCFCIFDLIYCVDFGIYLEASINNYTTIGLLANGIAEMLAFTWVYNHEVSIEKVGKKAFWVFTGILMGGCGLGAILLGIRYTAVLIVGGVIFVGSVILGFGLGYYYCSPTTSDGEVLSWKSKMWWLYLGPAEVSRVEFNSIMGGNMQWWKFNQFTIFWTLLCRFFIPPVLMVMLVAFVAYPADWTSTTQPPVYNIVGAAVEIIFDVGSLLLFAIWPRLGVPLTPEVCVAMVPKRYPAGCDDKVLEEVKLEEIKAVPITSEEDGIINKEYEL